MQIPIPDCYDVDRQAEAMDLAYTARIMRRPRCRRCENPLQGDTYLKLHAIGTDAFLCQTCVEEMTGYIDDLEDD